MMLTDTSEHTIFDAVVVGSGFGGSVCASQLARAHLSVVVLERGAPYPPGSFPRTPRQMRTSFWDPDAGLHGLFEVWSFEHVNAIVSSGLGGGSLIYANVMLRKPADTFQQTLPDGTVTSWPLKAKDLEGPYQAVLDFLRPVPLRDDLPKTLAFEAAARAAGFEVERPPLAIRFAPPGERPGVPLPPDGNLHGRARLTCRLLGDCDVGCNEGAKSSLDMTYLSDAKDHGAHIRTLCEAVGIERAGRDAWSVRYVQRVGARDGHPTELLDPTLEVDRRIKARIVILAAGTFGSTRLLLAHRATLPGLSPQLGRRFSTNGDMITFARNCREPDGAWRDLSPSLGPVITASAHRATPAPREGDRTPTGLEHSLWLQDAGGPDFSEWLWQTFEVPADTVAVLRRMLVRAVAEAVGGRRRTRVSADVAHAFGSARASKAMLPLLSMGLDVPGGRHSLDGDVLQLDWEPDGDSRDYFRAAQAGAREAATALGGRLATPRPLMGRARAVTVHPLGGCAMGPSRDSGVVDLFGEVFSAPGLFVADGAVMPGPVGPNPSLTIAALAHRFSTRMIARAKERRTKP